MDDGVIEIVGFRDAWHGLVLLSPNGHGTRLAQVGVRLSIVKVIFVAYSCFILLFSSNTNQIPVSEF